MAASSSYDKETLDYMKTKSLGVLGNAPPTRTVSRTMQPTHTPLIPPYFIDANPCKGYLTNRCNVRNTPDIVYHTLTKYIEESKDLKSLMNKLLFSCYHKILLHVLGVVTQHLETTKTRTFVPVITGGMAIRFINQSYLTSDLDVKVFPLGLTDDSSYDHETYIEKEVKPLFKYYLTKVMKEVDINNELFNYIRYYLEPFYSTPGFHDIKTVGETLNMAAHKIISFSFDYPDKFDETTRTFTTEKDKSVLKLICTLNDETSQKLVFKLMDISAYNPSNETYNSIINEYYEADKTMTKVSNYIPPLDYVVLNTLPYYIVDYGFMEFEKTKLLKKYESNEYMTKKFTRSIKGIEASKSGHQPYVFMGGKTNRKNKHKKHTKKYKKHHTKRRKRTHKK